MASLQEAQGLVYVPPVDTRHKSVARVATARCTFVFDGKQVGYSEVPSDAVAGLLGIDLKDENHEFPYDVVGRVGGDSESLGDLVVSTGLPDFPNSIRSETLGTPTRHEALSTFLVLEAMNRDD